ncbi:MAG: hypothetical protein P8X54_08545 [Desulfuromonadales bacterium]
MEAGIYFIGKEGDIKFSRHAYSFLDLKGTDEFLVSQGVPYKNTKYTDYRSVVNIVTKGSFMDMNGESTSFAKKVISYCYDTLSLRE